MSREAHVQFCGSLGVRFPGATHPGVMPELASINAPKGCSSEIVESEIEILLAYRALPYYFISSSAAIVSTPYHRFCKRRFSLAAC
jgi:hypothetical protein